MAYPPVPTLLVAAVPAIQSWTGFADPANGPITGTALTQGSTLSADTLNEREGRSDLQGRYGGGVWGVIPGDTGGGCDLTVVSGLTLGISAGAVMFDGVLPVDPASVVLTDGVSRVFIWLSQAGAIVTVNASTTPPAGAHVFLGSCATNSPAGSITGIDFAGVVYLNGGKAQRFSNDSGMPLDTPPTNTAFLHYSEGDGSRWEWTGSEYLVFGGLAGTLPISGGGTGATTAPLARASLGAQQTGHFDVQVAGATTVAAADLISASHIRLVDNGVSTFTTVEFPNTGLTNGMKWTVRNATGEGIRLFVTGGSNNVFMQDGHIVEVTYHAAEIYESGRKLPRHLSSPDQVINTPTTLTNWEQIESDYVEWLPQDALTLVEYPASLEVKGRYQIIQNGSTSNSLDVSTDGISATDEAAHTYLLPGEFAAFMVELNGNFTPVPTRARTRRTVAEFPSDADYTLVFPFFLAEVIEVDSAVALTVTRNLILPTVDEKGYFIANTTTGGQSIVAKTAAGTGITIANGNVQRVFCDGVNIRALSPPTAY